MNVCTHVSVTDLFIPFHVALCVCEYYTGYVASVLFAMCDIISSGHEVLVPSYKDVCLSICVCLTVLSVLLAVWSSSMCFWTTYAVIYGTIAIIW